MRYLSLVGGHHPYVCIDLKMVDRRLVSDALYYADKFGSRAYLSNYKDIFKAPFKRRQDNDEILLNDTPKRLEGEELLTFLEDLLVRAKDKEKRTMHPNSLRNLKPRRPFTAVDRPLKPPTLTQDQLIQAKLLRDAGVSWRGVGDSLNVNYETARSALRRWGSNSQISAPNSSQKQG